MEQTAVEFRCLCVMGMASVSWFYLFNIQVRANCTTACNIQAALQYVELTHVSISVSFFLYLFHFTKMCMQLGTDSKVMLAPPFSWWEEPAGQTENEHWCWCPDRSVWLVTFTFTEMHKGNCEWFFFFCLFVCFLISWQRNERNQWRDCCFFSFFNYMFFSKS